ncbi:MAG TPA: VCBS repeat-containing protein, partial [Thermoanaerobaculia bacterium]|nr:VCBS repeat-containing protein [Thermoanaerobaculia bacterium]
MSPRTPCLLALSLLLAIAAPAQTPDEGIVRDFWPSRLGKDVEKLFDFARADLDGTGRGDYIVAIYGNSPCVVRVLRAAGGAPSLVAEAAPDAMGGHAPRLRLVDLDGDGRPEIVAAFATITGGEVTWIFR